MKPRRHPIITYGEPRLEAPNATVTRFDQDLEQLVEDMKVTCWAVPGVGLAAPQIGVNQRVAIIDTSIGEDPDALIVLVNPELVESRGKSRLEEGCLSFPGLFTHIVRPSWVRVRAQDISGSSRELEGEGLLAQAFCHELDHLDGVLIVHHLTGLKQKMFLRRVDKMRRLGVWT